ncbi:MAG: helix-hairpin-helix domain-containing protein [Silvibacterium sp.]
MNGTRKLWKYRKFSASAACLVLLCFAGCNPSSQSDQQVKQQAAQTTEQVKAGAQQAAADAKVAAANAERKVNDIAAGVREGLHGNAAPGKGLVDINSASELRLVTLPGVTLTRARRIVNGRPYATPHDLVAKGVLSRTEYARISARIVAR